MKTRRQIDPPREQFSLFDVTMPLRSEVAQDDLPKTARELVQVIGLDSTIDLVKMCSGDELKIPEVINGSSRVWAMLVDAVGPDAASRLVQRYAGTPLYVPTCAVALRAHRDREIIRRIDAGEDFDVVRRDNKITRRHMYRVLKKPL